MNETAAIREGEELDLNKLQAFLADNLPETSGNIAVSQFPAGSSNLTYLVAARDREYVLRRPPAGNTVKTAHDMRREFDVLQRLSEVYPPAPRPLLFCGDDSVLGAEFYLMERRNGIVIRGRLPGKLAVNGPKENLELCRAFVTDLAVLHSVDHRAAGLGDLGKPEGYNRRQVEGWSGRYFAAKTDEHPELETVIAWLNERIPAESGASLIHNDYKFDNVMLDPERLDRIVAVLDWEMVTVGDPLMDLGTTLGYWMSPDAGEEMLNMPFNPRILMESISRRQIAEMYAEGSGRDVAGILFYYVFGTFKIAVIAQQIYARYVKGSTRDPRFANFNKFVSALGRIAARAIERESI